MIYLDYNATTPLDKRVLKKMLPYLRDIYGNPSSIYSFAQKARKAIEDARQNVADLISASVEEIIFTAGGSESNNAALKGITFYHAKKGKHIITSKIEHEAILSPCKFLEKQGFEITYLNVDKYGTVKVEELREKIRKDTILVSIMHANNEVGTLQPIKELAQICRQKQIYLHTDAVQSAGKIPIDVSELGVDLLSLSAHKFYGPKGIGALYVRKGIEIEPLVHGGYQEKGRRAGTENVSGIVGLGEAAKLARLEMKEEEKRIRVLRDGLEAAIVKKIPQIKVNGHPQNRLYNTLNICIEDVSGESILVNLDFKGICASSGSACASGSQEPSHVLLAMGVTPELARSSLRLSLGKHNTQSQMQKVLGVLSKIVQNLRKASSSWPKN
jgi:cysteine desulfurase